MRARYVGEMVPGARVDGAYLLKSKELRTARTGDAYLAVEIADKTGSVRGVLFRPSSDACSIPVGAVVTVRGLMSSFRGARRITLDSMGPADAWADDDLMATAPQSADELIAEFTSLTKSITDPAIRALMRAVFAGDGFFEAFAAAPGSDGSHHAYRHGLIEHTVSVGGACHDLALRYPLACRDLLVAAALMHDVGVADALNWDSAISPTEEGRLLGHVTLTLRRIDRAAAASGLEPIPLLAHAIATHHDATGETASHEGPMTLEAILLGRADSTDLDASAYSAAASGAAAIGERWTDSANRLQRPLRVRSAGASVSPCTARGKTA